VAISLPNQIKKAYQNKDWSLVAKSYKMLTGQDLDIDPVSTEFPMEPDDDDGEDIIDDIDLDEQPKKRGRPKRSTYSTNSVVNPNRPNLFLKMMPSLAKDKSVKRAGEFDKLAVYTAAKSERSRSKARKVTVNCSVCNQKFKVWISEIPNGDIEGFRYRCNGCCGGLN
jgi:hypothetical protein